MLTKIAWRNIWRSRTRSWVVIGAIILGIWAMVFMTSFSVGMVRSYVNNAIENTISHLQVHKAEYREDQEVEYYFTPTAAQQERLAALPHVEGVATRTLANGMLGASRGTRGMLIRGVEPAAESQVTHLDQRVVEGDYLDTTKRNPILISQRTADELKLKVRSKVVLTFQDLEGHITAGAFRVTGLYDTGSKPFDESTVFVSRADLSRLLGNENMAHEMAFFLDDVQVLDSVAHSIQEVVPDLKVETYREISPDVQLYESQIQTSANIFMTIIMLALLFGIVNTMLMAVLERYRELGMLMSIGMNKGRVFGMIVLETLFLALVAVVPGLLLGWGTVSYLAQTGIDLSAFSKGMAQFGMSTIVYPALDSKMYLQMAGAVGFTAILGALYPAYKAISLRPVEAIRKI